MSYKPKHVTCYTMDVSKKLENLLCLHSLKRNAASPRRPFFGLKVRVFLLVVFLLFSGFVDQHLPTASRFPARRHTVGAVFLVLCLWLVIAGDVQRGVVVAAVLNEVKLFTTRLTWWNTNQDRCTQRRNKSIGKYILFQIISDKSKRFTKSNLKL